MAGLTLLELTPVQASLEEAFMALTQDAVEYRAPTPVSVASRDADLYSDGIAA
jgi:ABC-2 type transport system ATP-binding protein